MVCIERLLLRKGDTKNVLPIAVVYCVPYHVVCIVPALVIANNST